VRTAGRDPFDDVDPLGATDSIHVGDRETDVASE
jgi:hypothetical protein